MKRKLYSRVTLASLLLLCGTLLWWNRTSHRTDHVTLHGVGGTSLRVTASAGQVMFSKADSGDSSGGQLRWESSADGGNGKLMSTSFSFTNQPGTGTSLIVPTWALAFVFAVCPSLWVYSKVKRKGGKKKSSEAH